MKRNILECMSLVGTMPSYFNGEKVYVSTGAVDHDYIDYAKTEAVTYRARPSRANLAVDEGNIIFAKMYDTEKTLYIDSESAKYIFSTGFYAVRARENVVMTKLLYYIIGSDQFLKQKDRYCSGATQKAITNAGLKKMTISVPPLDEQPGIILLLDKISDLIAKRRQQLDKLDEMVKARFVEMFGTLSHPSQKFKYDILKNLCRKITDGKHGGCTPQLGSGRYFVGAREIFDDAVHYETAPEISIDEFEKDYKRCNLEIGDLLIVNTGATIGKSAIACDFRTQHTLLQKSVALLKVKSELINPVFLKYCYRVNETMYKVESASAQPNLLLSKINTTLIYVPPIALQNQFAAFVEQTEKSKTTINRSLEKLETLKKALMQEYFG